jgi:hypothetical protein
LRFKNERPWHLKQQRKQTSTFLNPFTDYGFKRLFGTEENKNLLIDFLNQLLPAHHQIVNLFFKSTEQIPVTKEERKAFFDINCITTDGGHIIIEYRSNILNKWVMIDPLFTWIPRTKGGNMASIKYVAKHWPDFEAQMPEDFKNQYRYTSVRYTNWDKYGVVSTSVYKILTFLMGKDRTDALSLRMWIIDAYRVQSVLALLFSALCIGLIAFDWKRSKS